MSVLLSKLRLPVLGCVSMLLVFLALQPPAATGGQSCFQQCAPVSASCRADCDADHQACWAECGDPSSPGYQGCYDGCRAVQAQCLTNCGVCYSGCVCSCESKTGGVGCPVCE
jgi:hypothetical protein